MSRSSRRSSSSRSRWIATLARGRMADARMAIIALTTATSMKVNPASPADPVGPARRTRIHLSYDNRRRNELNRNRGPGGVGGDAADVQLRRACANGVEQDRRQQPGAGRAQGI